MVSCRHGRRTRNAGMQRSAMAAQVQCKVQGSLAAIACNMLSMHSMHSSKCPCASALHARSLPAYLVHLWLCLLYTTTLHTRDSLRCWLRSAREVYAGEGMHSHCRCQQKQQRLRPRPHSPTGTLLAKQHHCSIALIDRTAPQPQTRNPLVTLVTPCSTGSEHATHLHYTSTGHIRGVRALSTQFLLAIVSIIWPASSICVKRSVRPGAPGPFPTWRVRLDDSTTKPCSYQAMALTYHAIRAANRLTA